MNKALSFIAIGILAGSFVNNFDMPQKGEAIEGEFAKPGMVAYAASYSSDPTSEPKYTTQNSTTFQYLNLGSTLNNYRGDSVKVGIIDSGINYDHEDFMVSGSTKVKGDSKYYSYQSSSSSWVYYKASQHGYSYIDDTLGHGTNVAATVAAAINDVGGLGLAPNVELYVYKVTNSSNGYEFGAIQNALMDAKNLGLDVINMSFQSYEHAVNYGSSSMSASSGCSTILSYYLNQAYNAGITLVGAAGNYNTAEPSYPGSNSNVINVGSLNETATGKAGFSNYGSTIDLVAPGYVYVADEASNSAYTNTQGTSFSAPLVTAAIALYKQKNPSATPSQIESALYASCDEIDDSSSPYSNWAGHGALNVARFLGVEENAPTEIVINNQEVVNDELSLEVGDTFDLDWNVNGNGTFDDSVSIYALEDNGVISVNSSGHITALANGSDYVVIKSNANPNIYASIYVTVTSSGGSPTVTDVHVTPGSLTLDLNGTTSGTLTATVEGNNNPPQTVTWTSNNENVATVNSSGVVTAVGTGSTTITARSTHDNSKSGDCLVTVNDSTVHVTGVSLDKNSITIAVGDSETLTASVLPNNATNKNVIWATSDSTIATVNNGTVTGIKKGTATISVTTSDGGHQASCIVKVEDVQTQTLTITRSSFATDGGYAWYDWSQATTDSTTISGKAELYTTTTTSMQFNKNKGSKVAAIFNTTAIPGSITKIEATSAQTTIRSWTAYVTSTACSASGSTLTFGSNKTTVGTISPAVGTSTSFGTSNAGYSFFCLQENDSSASYLSEIKITYVPISISSISIKTAPNKLAYESGDHFDPTGLVITATYSDDSTSDITYAGHEQAFTFDPSTSASLTTANTSVTITYGNKTCSQAITVTAVKELLSISISGYKTSFVEGDAFSFGGTVTAHFNDSTSDTVTSSATFSGYNMTTLGEQEITVSYTNKSTTKTAKYNINVAQGTLDHISLSGQTTTYVKDAPFAFDGVCTATFVNGYQKIVTPTSVTSPDMTTGGVKTVTVSYEYNGRTKTAQYDITVNAYRHVEEETTEEAEIGNVTYTTVQNISNNTLSASTSGYTTIENNSIRLGSGSNTGSITVSSTTANIVKIVVSAKSYGSDTGVTLTIAGTGNTITSSYSNYEKEFNTATDSVTIATTTNKKRANIERITLYYNKTVTNDISESEDCLGLESFITENMHMDYVESLGYCKDNEHHYYSTAKEAFNDLNDHQRKLFTTNEAYLSEWTRLSTWATFNGESLQENNTLSLAKSTTLLGDANNSSIIILVLSISVSSILGFAFYIRKKHKK